MIDSRTKAEKLADNNDKCKHLELLGFKIVAGDYCHVIASNGGIEFDFSTTENHLETLIRSAIIQAHNIGFAVGESDVQSQIKQALGLD